jgi:hypothetical protein
VIASIRTALKTQLATLVEADPPSAGKLLRVGDWLGEITRSAPISFDALGQTPCALVAAAREAFEDTPHTTGETLVLGDSRWVIFLVVANPVEPEQQVSHMDALLTAVTGKLAALRIDGGWGTSLFRLIDWSPFRVERGCITYAVQGRFVRQLDTEDNRTVGDDEGDALSLMDGDINLADTDADEEPAANPLAKTGGDLT